MEKPTTADKFAGLVGAWKQLANFGVVGVVAALLVWQSVSTHQAHREDMRAFREEAVSAHGKMDTLAAATRENEEAVRELTRAVRKLIAEVQRKPAAHGDLELVPEK